MCKWSSVCMRCTYRELLEKEEWREFLFFQVICLTVFKVHLQNISYLCCSRTFLSIIGGVVAGILGFTSLKGFVFYFLLMMVTSLGLVAKARFSIHSYFDSSNRVLLDGFLGGLMVGFLFVYMRSGLCMANIFCLIKQESLLDNKGREVHKNRGQK